MRYCVYNDDDLLLYDQTELYDDDGDGFTEADGDCHDGDATVFPGATETANYVDDDCDGVLDEETVQYDDDGDGATETGGDCDDADPDVGPHMVEVPYNGVDDDCDGMVD